MDISFYAFKLDFIEEVNQIVLVLLIAFAVLTVIYYSILLTVRTPKILKKRRRLLMKKRNSLRHRAVPETDSTT